MVALFPYTANNPDELSFLKDDIINVTARDEEAWWRGELNGVSGLFPSNYVAPLQQHNQCKYPFKSRERSRPSLTPVLLFIGAPNLPYSKLCLPTYKRISLFNAILDL